MITPVASVRAFFSRHPLPSVLGVAVSGGSDSLALLLALRQAFPDIKLRAATVDHGLRPQSSAEAAQVARICAQLKIPHDILAIKGLSGGSNMQARARKARYAMLADWGRMICLGHSRTDQAETFLMNLARGSGVDGLAAMPDIWIRNGCTWMRPLLAHSRAELQEWLQKQGQNWINDPTNLDDSYTRIKLRMAATDLANLGLTETRLAQTAQRMQQVHDALKYAEQGLAAQAIQIDLGDVIINNSKLSDVPDELAQRLYARALSWVGGAIYKPRNTALRRVMATKAAATLQGCVILPQKDGRMRITREAKAIQTYTCPGNTLWDRRFRFAGGSSSMHIRALGPDGLAQCPDWRCMARPRIALLASPSLWQKDDLLAAPAAGFDTKYTLKINSSPFDTALHIEVTN